MLKIQKSCTYVQYKKFFSMKGNIRVYRCQKKTVKKIENTVDESLTLDMQLFFSANLFLRSITETLTKKLNIHVCMNSLT